MKRVTIIEGACVYNGDVEMFSCAGAKQFFSDIETVSVEHTDNDLITLSAFKDDGEVKFMVGHASDFTAEDV